MPKCYPCLSLGIKKYLKEVVDEELHAMIDEMPTCPAGEVLTLCPVPTESYRTAGTKRAPSAYNEYISQCMKAKPIKGKPFGEAAKYMKLCAQAWREKKKVLK